MQPLIEIKNVSKSYDASPVLRDCTLNVSRGEVIVVCGPSGSGKSTLLKCINGLEHYQSGSIRIDGIDVGAKGTDLPLLRSHIGMVFQHFELYPHMSVIENVSLAQIHVKKRTRQQAHERSRQLLARVGLEDKQSAFPGNLSGGQQQRVAIARALALDPQALLFDEPTSALDPEMISEVLAVITELASEGMTMIVVTHEMGFARRAAHRIAFMDQGEIVEDSPKQAFFLKPATPRAREFLSKILTH